MDREALKITGAALREFFLCFGDWISYFWRLLGTLGVAWLDVSRIMAMTEHGGAWWRVAIVHGVLRASCISERVQAYSTLGEINLSMFTLNVIWQHLSGGSKQHARSIISARALYNVAVTAMLFRATSMISCDDSAEMQ